MYYCWSFVRMQSWDNNKWELVQIYMFCTVQESNGKNSQNSTIDHSTSLLMFENKKIQQRLK